MMMMKTQIAAGLLCSLILAAPALAMHNATATRAQSHLTQGDKEVRALNLLEAAGYRNMSELQRTGSEFSATASKRGSLYNVQVAANGKISAKPI
jgi:hypothetical protein